MPLMEIIKRVNKLSNPIQLTRDTGIIEVTEYDPVKEKLVTKQITTWCHSKAYYKLRSSVNITAKRVAKEEHEQPRAITKSDETSKTLRSFESSLKNLSPLEKECVIRLLGDDAK